MKKLLPIGTRVRALHDIYFPGRGLIAHKGQFGNIANVTIDSQFGFYPVHFDKQELIIPVCVSPAFNANVEVVQ